MDDIPLDVFFSDESFSDVQIPGFPGINFQDPEECEMFKVMSIELVIKHFKNGCKTIFPLKKDQRFESILIAINMSEPKRPFLAGYGHAFSNSRSKVYGFQISRELLKEYYRELIDKNFVIDPLMRYVWEHEMVHITEPGADGKPFVEPSVFFELVERIRAIKPSRPEKSTYQQYVRSNQAVSILFLSFWPDLNDFKKVLPVFAALKE